MGLELNPKCFPAEIHECDMHVLALQLLSAYKLLLLVYEPPAVLESYFKAYFAYTIYYTQAKSNEELRMDFVSARITPPHN